MNNKKFHWINENIELDFEIPLLLKNTMKEAEELDLQQNTEYMHVADAIDIMCKGYVKTHRLTQEQWDLIIAKYPYI